MDVDRPVKPTVSDDANHASDPTVRHADSEDAGGTELHDLRRALEPAAEHRPADGPRVLVADRYTLERRLGEGGMGEVWLAHQAEPVRRRVALKLIKPGMDSRAVLLRFEAERQALAVMDHPNIARVFDGGLTDDRRPFFAMELVEGAPLTAFCDEARLGITERLALFVQVCRAVQHAHQKGVIHRDLKPSNILVAVVDGTPVPKVIDFGVAKAVGGKLIDAAATTQVGAVVGTLEYMAPEQAGGDDVDTRADIYALGVVLYELLTGLRPLEEARLRRAAVFGILRALHEEEPSRPSTRLSTAEHAASLAAARRTEPRRLARLLRGELDWVVMKCLEKERSRRYETASSLARDLERYLADEPVEARPPSAGYRLLKFVRRHRPSVAAATLMLLALVSGIAGTTWGLLRARQQERLARRALAEKEQARLVAERRLAQLERGTDLIAGIFRDLDVQRIREGGRPLEAELGDRLAAAAETLEGDGLGDPITVARLQLAMGESLIGLGHLAPAARLLEKSVQTRRDQLGGGHPDTLASRSSLATCYAALGRLAEAATLREQLLTDQRQRLGPDHPEVLLGMNRLAVSYALLGRHADAVTLGRELLALQRKTLGADHPRTLATMNNLAHSLSALGRYAEALPLVEQTHALLRAKLGPDHPDTLTSQTNLANCLFDLGRNPESLKLRRELLAQQGAKRGADHPSTLEALHNLVLSEFAAGRTDEALKHFEELLPARKAKLGLGHPYSLESVSVGALLMQGVGRKREALDLLDEALTAAGREDDPGIEPLVLILRVQAGTLRGDADACRRAVERLEAIGGSDAQGLYDQAAATGRLAAAMRATTGSPSSGTIDVQATRAVSLLQRAVEAGYRNLPWLEHDPAWDALRPREDFGRVLDPLRRPAAPASGPPARPEG